MRLVVYAACLMMALICCACGGGAGQSAPGNAQGTGANGSGAASSNTQGAGAQGGAPLAGPAHQRPGAGSASTPSPSSSSPSSSSSMGGGGEAIDTSKYDAEVARLEQQATKKGASEAERASLAHAYLERANALTKARQYRAALGDYRRTLKYDPSNDEAKNMAGTIVSILQQMGRDVPKEGAEPSPLPYQKQ